jgi:pimeloyl-ACP methyl ester carboxylesterase
MKGIHWGLLLAGLIFISLSVWQIQAAEKGIMVLTLSDSQPPLTVFQARGADPYERPTVLVAHGFAGSSVIMRGYALTLAQAGFNVITWDFDGHGSNPIPLQFITQREGLLTNAEKALDEAIQKGLLNTGQVAILGHSMGSGVALAYGQAHPETDATIAVSPVLREVTPELPRNLLLMAGTSEASFLTNAIQLLEQAGGQGGDHRLGNARALLEIQGANHLSILFTEQSHQAARDWLESVYGLQSGRKAYSDQRMAWFALGVLGTLFVAYALAKLASTTIPVKNSSRPLWRRFLALVAGILVATLSLGLLSQIGLDLSTFFGLLIGGYLMIWFAISGVIAWLVLGTWPGWPSLRTILAGLMTFSALWLGIGLLGNMVWQPWLLVQPRLILFPLTTLFLLPWFLSVGELGRGMGWLGQGSAWFAHSFVLLGGLYLAMRLTSGIGFLILIAPVFPVFFALHALGSGPYRGGWSFALSGALFTSWMLLAVFPLG